MATNRTVTTSPPVGFTPARPGGRPAGGMVGAAPRLVGEFAAMCRANPWLILFGVLVVAQTAHLGEHIVQVLQVHLLHMPEADARGIIKSLNDEWVHFWFNLGVFLIVAVLLRPFGRNFWLQACLLFTGWHAIEHCVIIWTYIQTGIDQTPGLLSKGGLIMGGFPLGRRAMHLLYNGLEADLLILALAHEVLNTRRRNRKAAGRRRAVPVQPLPLGPA